MNSYGIKYKYKGYIEARSPVVREISEKLNAAYFNDINTIKDHFNLSEKDKSEMIDSNVIAGKIEGHDYCFIEYYHLISDSRSRDFSRWVSKLYIRMKNDYFPNFELITNKNLLIQIATYTFFGLFLLFPLSAMFSMFLNHQKELPNIFAMTFVGIFFLFALFAFVILIIKIFKILLKFLKQYKYEIHNPEFRMRYSILSDYPPSAINNVFSNKVCSNILREKKDINIIFTKRCAHTEFNLNEQLSFERCEEKLNELNNIIKLFEKVD